MFPRKERPNGNSPADLRAMFAFCSVGVFSVFFSPRESAPFLQNVCSECVLTALARPMYACSVEYGAGQPGS